MRGGGAGNSNSAAGIFDQHTVILDVTPPISSLTATADGLDCQVRV